MHSLDGSDPSHIGRYRLVGRLGEGGMGRVYLARSPGGRPVAVKVINDHLRHDEHALSRFRREVETLGTVRSAYTASLIDAELETPPYWLATEYVPGPTLHAAVMTHGPLPADLARIMLAALAEGLDAIHVRGVWHRDLKPHNVILSATGPQLIDFGIARNSGPSDLTQVGGAMGSPGYIAPETITGSETGPGADVFALGATLAFAVTGRPPYGDGPFAAVSYRSVHGEIDLRGVDPGVVELISACVHSDPARRPHLQRIVELCQAETDLVQHPAYQRALAMGPAPERERAATAAGQGSGTGSGMGGPTGSGGMSVGLSDATAPLAPPMTTATAVGTREADAFTLLAPGANPGPLARPHAADTYGAYPDDAYPVTAPTARPDGAGRQNARRGRAAAIGAGVLVAVAAAALLLFHAFGDEGSGSARATPSVSADRAADRSAGPSQSGAKASPSAAGAGTDATPGAGTDATSGSDTGTGADGSADGSNLPDALVLKPPFTFEVGKFVKTVRSRLIMQTDGNLVLYDESGKARWASRTQGPGNTAVFQADGNLVVYGAQAKPLWASNTQGADGATLKVLEDGNMVIAIDDRIAWQTGTAH
ncbi:protein kinase domain-containing protein [Streptomyces sp. NBC_01462]|uniref:protein kinase domain-containing protein n=1 Tax=Streptomyces sp. NBC_01462 TaxID=2903876 RepID=UPI002E2F6887|nr:protein kinase [Streptomyces sp. NBC_01462]